jgi:hypothetical protein
VGTVGGHNGLFWLACRDAASVAAYVEVGLKKVKKSGGPAIRANTTKEL